MSLFISNGNDLLTPEEFSYQAQMITTRGPQLPVNDQPIGFTPIGLGKPLAIEIREMYTGKLPTPTWLGLDAKKDMILTTSHKPITQQAASSRAVNMVKEKVSPETRIRDIAAVETGTPIIYYSPAMVENSISLTVEFGFEDLSRKTFELLSGAFQTAAEVPLFATKSMWLLAGSRIASLIGELGKVLFEKSADFAATGSINFGRAGIPESLAGFGLLVSQNTPPTVYEDYKLDETGKLVHKQDGQIYNGEYPYVVLSFDGAKNEAYESFQASTISAELLARFYDAGDNSSQAVDELLKGLQYYSDIQYLNDARKIKSTLQSTTDSTEKEKLQKQYEALLANILTEELQALS